MLLVLVCVADLLRCAGRSCRIHGMRYFSLRFHFCTLFSLTQTLLFTTLLFQAAFLLGFFLGFWINVDNVHGCIQTLLQVKQNCLCCLALSRFKPYAFV